MPDAWKDYRDWKQLMENIRKPRQEDEDYSTNDDDDVKSLIEILRDYSE